MYFSHSITVSDLCSDNEGASLQSGDEPLQVALQDRE